MIFPLTLSIKTNQNAARDRAINGMKIKTVFKSVACLIVGVLSMNFAISLIEGGLLFTGTGIALIGITCLVRSTLYLISND